MLLFICITNCLVKRRQVVRRARRRSQSYVMPYYDRLVAKSVMRNKKREPRLLRPTEPLAIVLTVVPTICTYHVLEVESIKTRDRSCYFADYFSQRQVRAQHVTHRSKNPSFLTQDVNRIDDETCRSEICQLALGGPTHPSGACLGCAFLDQEALRASAHLLCKLFLRPAGFTS